MKLADVLSAALGEGFEDATALSVEFAGLTQGEMPTVSIKFAVAQTVSIVMGEEEETTYRGQS